MFEAATDKSGLQHQTETANSMGCSQLKRNTKPTSKTDRKSAVATPGKVSSSVFQFRSGKTRGKGYLKKNSKLLPRYRYKLLDSRGHVDVITLLVCLGAGNRYGWRYKKRWLTVVVRKFCFWHLLFKLTQSRFGYFGFLYVYKTDMRKL